EPRETHRPLHDGAAARDAVVRLERDIHVRRGQAGAGEPAQISPLREGRRDRLARRDRREPGAVRVVRGPVRAGRVRRGRGARPGRHARAPAAHDVLLHVAQSGARLFQPHPDPTARRQPRLLSPPPPRGGPALSPAVCARVRADSGRELVRAGRDLGVPVAGTPVDEPGSRVGGRLSDRGGHMTALPPAAQDQNGFVIELEQFSGPLDLLLHLIHEDELDITDLPISKIADQFLAVINELGLNQAADYLEMTARLLRIKAQMLLPRRLGDDEWEDPRAELVRRLLEYQRIRGLDVVGARPTLVDVLSVFIALLELAKRGSLSVHQEGAFTTIQIRRESPREAV